MASKSCLFRILVSFCLVVNITAEWGATDALREYMRHQDPGTTHATTTANLRGGNHIDEELMDALHSPRISTVQAAMEHVLSRHSGDYDEDLFKRVRHWYEELDKRMGMLKHCKMIKGQGWDGECLSIDNWWNSVRYKERLDKPWNGR